MQVQKVSFSAPRRLQEPEEGGAEFRQYRVGAPDFKVNARFDVE
ncbi:hypothetical protein [Paenibacillus foliorum]|nr:hypothetical protein [Paenibacillus foliorum]